MSKVDLEKRIHFSSKDLELLCCVKQHSTPVDKWEQAYLRNVGYYYRLKCNKENADCKYVENIFSENYCVFDDLKFKLEIYKRLTE